MILRSEIETALNEIISYESWKPFQVLAVLLAKRRWPELIACEPKNDLGLDAYASGALAADAIGKGLAASLTGTLGKVKSDARRTKGNYPDVSLFIFATPRPITKQAERIWAQEIRNEFELELIVISREEIIDSLLEPQNAPLCRSILGIPVPLLAHTQDLVERARAATNELAEAWLVHPRRSGRPHIDLRIMKLDEHGNATEEIIGIDGIRASLASALRIILEAPAGRGKTTTLVHLAKRAGSDELAFLIDFPDWARSPLSILEYLAQMRYFQSRAISAGDLATLYDVQHFTFLLNGWNEVSEAYSEGAAVKLMALEREYPGAGICLATRTRLVSPPLPGALRAKLLPLIRPQRNEYLRLSLESRADELGRILDNNHILDELTRTPFILSAVVDLFRSGRTIPTTRIGVLRETTKLLEEADEHRQCLQGEPLEGRSKDYLAELATSMTGQRTTRVSEQSARSIVNGVSIKLRETGLITEIPGPRLLLDALCDHHVLERLNYEPDSLSFEHQQFQELYAAVSLKNCLSELVQSDNRELDQAFTRDYLNEPKWEEPLRMIAEEIGVLSLEPNGAVEVALGERLVQMALAVDPIFAAELSRLCGRSVWQKVRTTVGHRLRSWFAVDQEEHRQGALAAMIATGSDDFKDIILPRLKSDDSQVRLGTYRAGNDFHPTVLGDDWPAVVNGWSEEARTEFISVLAIHGSAYERFETIERFARTDPSPKVRADAAHELVWSGSRRVLWPALEELDDAAFELVVEDLDTHNIPPSLHERALEVRERLVAKSAHPTDRLGHLLMAADLGALRMPERLKEQLRQLEVVDLNNLGSSVIRPALDIIAKGDPEWVSHWVAERILDGSLWSDHWIGLVTSIPQGLKAELLDLVTNQNLWNARMKGIIPVLSASADVGVGEAAWKRLFELRRRDALGETDQAITRQLEDLILALPADIAVAGLLRRLATEVDLDQLTTVTRVLARTTESQLQSELNEELRAELRGYLKDGVTAVLSEDDYRGELKADLATALARIGSPEDMAELNRLLRADIERVKRGRADSIRRRISPLAQGAGICWARWHVRALISLDASYAEEVLLDLLNEPDDERYEYEAASALVDLARIAKSSEQFGHKIDYFDIWIARSGEAPMSFDEERRQHYAKVINGRLSTWLAERANNAELTPRTRRLKELAHALAVLDAKESAGLVMEVLAMPEEWDAWTRLKTMEALLFGGATLPAESTIDILNPAVDQIRAQGVSDHNVAWEFTRCLCILVFVDNPALGIERTRQLLAETPLWPSALRNLFRALGASRAGGGALSLLLDLRPPAGVDHAGTGEEWINAVASIGTPEAKRVLMASIEQRDCGTGVLSTDPDSSEAETLAARIGELVRNDDLIKNRVYELCAIQVQPAKRELLAKIIARVGTTEAMLAGLSLIDDEAAQSVPYDIQRALEDAFLERRPYLNTGSYTLVGRSSNELRAKLFEMSVSDAHRKRSAFALLGQIEVWRLEHGRPVEEPRHPAFESGLEWPLDFTE